MAFPLNGSPKPIPNAPGGSTPPTLSGQGQGYCSLPLNAASPQVIGYGSDPAFVQPQGQLVNSVAQPSVSPSQTNPNANPNKGAL